MTAKERVIKEINELIEKMQKLIKFTGSENFKKLNKRSKFLLIMQLDAMADYAIILKERIDTWEEV